MKRLGRAIALAAEVHKDQFDKADQPYILHPLAVMERARNYYLANSDGYMLEEVMIVAVLHDVLEDMEAKAAWSHGRLASMIHNEFGDEVLTAVESLTKYHKSVGETYEEYLGRVESNWLSRIAKIADLSHNLDAFRMPSGKIGEYDYKRWDKYHRAIVRLTNV